MNGINQGNQLASTFSGFYSQDGIDFKKIFSQLFHYKWIILLVSICTATMAFFHTFTIQSEYQTNAIIYIKPQSASNSALSKLGYKANSESTADTQIALMRTRYIMEPVIAQNNLNIVTSLPYFPVFGQWIARHHQGNRLAKPLWGLKSYAWGGEDIQIKTFSIPANYRGQSFRLTAVDKNSYKLYSSQGQLLVDGKIGQLSTSNAISGFSIEITSLKARFQTAVTIGVQLPIDMVDGLIRNLTIKSIIGNDPTQSTGLYQLQLIGSDPNRTVGMLNAIINYTIAQNLRQNAQETQKTLDFLGQRLPELKQSLAKTEDAVNQYHMQNKTVSMSMVGGLLVQQLKSLKEMDEKLKTQKAELLQIYTPQHPLVIAMEQKQIELEKRINEVTVEIQKFPFMNQEEVNLQRDVRIKNSMYMSLFNNEQQLRLTKASLASDIAIISDATPATVIPSHKLLTIIMGFLMGAFLSTILIMIKSTFNKSIENSDQLEDALHIPVRAVLPYCRKQKQLEKAHLKGLNTFGSALMAPLILAKQEPYDMTIESLRSLRVSLHMIPHSEKNRVLALMGGLSDIGKSFISLNLAQVIADSGKKTILVDADLRKGLLHRAFHQPKSKGLSEYLEGKSSYDEIVRQVDENLYTVSCGAYTTHPIQLFQDPRFLEFIERIKREFDQVIIDTPPILPVTDSMLIAQHCDIKLFVVSARKDTLEDVKTAMKKARTHGIEMDGIVFNHRTPLTHGSRYYEQYAYGRVEATTA